MKDGVEDVGDCLQDSSVVVVVDIVIDRPRPRCGEPQKGLPESKPVEAFTLIDVFHHQIDTGIPQTASGMFKKRRVILSGLPPGVMAKEWSKKPLLHPELLSAQFSLFALCSGVVVLLQCVHAHIHTVREDLLGMAIVEPSSNC